MNLKEILKANGLNEEQIVNVISEMKNNKIFTASEENLDVRYNKLKTEHDALTARDAESQKLIVELQNATKGQEEVQNRIIEYESAIETLKKEAVQAKTESALKVGLMSAGAKSTDIDYLIFKIGHDADWKPMLDENGNIRGLDDKVKGLKTQFPSQFESSSNKKIEEKKLDKPEEKQTMSKEEFNKMGYQSKLKLYNDNPELYNELSND